MKAFMKRRGLLIMGLHYPNKIPTTEEAGRASKLQGRPEKLTKRFTRSLDNGSYGV